MATGPVSRQLTNFYTNFEYQVLEYLSSTDLLAICSVAKKWHENAMAVFWDIATWTRFEIQPQHALKQDNDRYSFLLMSEKDFLERKKEHVEQPILVTNKDNTHSLWGYKDGKWKLTTLSNFKIPEVWHQWSDNRVALFFEDNQDAFTTLAEAHDYKRYQIALSRILISIVASPNAHSIFRLENLLKTKDVWLHTRYPGTLHYYRKANDGTRKTITFLNPTPLTVAACLSEENGPYGAAIVEYLVEEKGSSLYQTNQFQFDEQPVPTLVAAFLNQKAARLQAIDDEHYEYEISETEQTWMDICIGLSVLAIPAVISCAILAPPPIAILITAPLAMLSLMNLFCCGGDSALGITATICSLTLFGIATGVTILTSFIGPVMCGIVATGLCVLAGLYLAIEYIKDNIQKRRELEAKETPEIRAERQRIESDSKKFQSLAKSVKPKIEPKTIDKFSGGLLHTIWQKQHSSNDMTSLTKSSENTSTRSFFSCCVS
jgi:hypothetical protein